MEALLKMPTKKRGEVIRLQRKLGKMYFNEKEMSLKSNRDLFKQLYHLKRVISENSQFLIDSLLRNVKEPLDFVLRHNMYEELFKDIYFLRLLVSESVTNRLIKACECKKVPNWLVEKTEMCAVAMQLYNKNN